MNVKIGIPKEIQEGEAEENSGGSAQGPGMNQKLLGDLIPQTDLPLGHLQKPISLTATAR